MAFNVGKAFKSVASVADDTQQKAATSLGNAATAAKNYGYGGNFTKVNPATQAQAPGARAQPSSVASLGMGPTGTTTNIMGDWTKSVPGTNFGNIFKTNPTLAKWTGQKTDGDNGLMGQLSDTISNPLQSLGGNLATAGQGALTKLQGILDNPAAYVGGFGGNFTNAIGLDNSAAMSELQKIIGSANQQFEDTRGVLGSMKGLDDAYLGNSYGAVNAYQNARDPAINDYLAKLTGLEGQAGAQHARTGAQLDDVMRETRDAMQTAETDAWNGRQYKGNYIDFNDPNNVLATDVRNMYEGQAQGARQQGLADVGVLSALGSQAMGNQIAGQPLTGGQLQAMSGGVQNRAQEAYRIAQQRMQDLRDQGIAQGFARTDKAYGNVQDALGRQDRLQGAYGSLIGQDAGMRKGMRDEMGGYASERMGVQTNKAREDLDMGQWLEGMKHSLGTGQGERDIAAIGTKYGTQQQAHGATAQLEEALRTGRLDLFKGLTTETIKALPELIKGIGAIVPG